MNLGNLGAATASNGRTTARPRWRSQGGSSCYSSDLPVGSLRYCLHPRLLAQGAKLTDPQIAHIAYTAHQLDIEAAQQALQKSSNKDVIAFAQDMERDQ
jgi:hypothetical protein